MDDRRDYHLKVLRQKNNRNKLADISYLSCTHREKFEKIEKALYDVDYNNCILQVSRAANAAPRKDKEPRRDNNRRY